MTEKITGKITKVDPSGYGFIISEEMKFVKFFFHWTGLEQTTLNFKELRNGMKVKFVPINIGEVEVENDRGPKAIKIEVIKETKDEKENEKATTN